MSEVEGAPQRWEIIASAVATAATTIATMLQTDTRGLVEASRVLESTPWWFNAALSVPVPVWWALTAVLGAGLFWLGTRLTKRWGLLPLFVPPAVMLALPTLANYVMYSPIRAAVGGGATFQF